MEEVPQDVCVEANQIETACKKSAYHHEIILH